MSKINTSKGLRPSPSTLPPRAEQLAVLKTEGYKGPAPTTRKKARLILEEILKEKRGAKGRKKGK